MFQQNTSAPNSHNTTTSGISAYSPWSFVLQKVCPCNTKDRLLHSRLIPVNAQNRLNNGLKGRKMDTKEAVKTLPHKLSQASILRTYLTVSILQITA